jgi:hypothetical protein
MLKAGWGDDMNIKGATNIPTNSHTTHQISLRSGIVPSIRVNTIGRYMVLATLFCLVATPLRYYDLGSGITPIHIMLLIVSFLVITLLLATRQPLFTRRIIIKLIPVCLLVTCSLLSLIHPVGSVPGLSATMVSQFGTLCVVIVVTSHLFNSTRSIEGALRAFLYIVCICSVTADVMVLMNTSPIELMSALGVHPKGDDLSSMLANSNESRFLGLRRAQGFLTHPIEFGSILLFGYGILRCFPRLIPSELIRRVVYLVILLGILSSMSRGPMLGVLIAEIVIWYLKRPKDSKNVWKWSFVVIFGCLLVVGSTAIPDIYNSIMYGSSEMDRSWAARLVDYGPVFTAAENHVFGIGYRHWYEYATFVGLPFDNLRLDNDFLTFLGETGPLGLFAYILFVLQGQLLGRRRPISTVIGSRIVGVIYLWQACTYDAFSFRAFCIVYVFLYTVLDNYSLKALNDADF